MKQPLVHLDMDSVISDFMFEYNKIQMPESRYKFHHAVKGHNIFMKLPYMPNANALLNLLFGELKAEVEILSSLGTWDAEISTLAMKQKQHWLAERGIMCRQKFVNSWAVKKDHAMPYSMIIDDREDVVEAYRKAGGHGVVYVAEKFHEQKDEIIEMYNMLKGKV